MGNVHHISPEKLEVRDEATRARVKLHNLAESNYLLSHQILGKFKTSRQLTETLEKLSGQSIRGTHSGDVGDMKRTTEKSWKLVLATNRDLPNDLRAKHTR